MRAWDVAALMAGEGGVLLWLVAWLTGQTGPGGLMLAGAVCLLVAACCCVASMAVQDGGRR